MKQLYLIGFLAFLLSISIVSASSYTWNFSTPSDYVYNTSLINVTGGVAKLIGISSITPYATYHLNEVSGTVVSELVNSSLNGMTINGPSWSAGKLNNSLAFTGSTQYVNFSSSVADFERTKQFSVEFWYKTSNTAQQIIMSKMENTGNYRGWEVYFDGTSTNRMYFDLSNVATTNHIRVYFTNSSIADNNWHHVVFTYNGSSTASGVKSYFDGTSQSISIVYNSLTGSILTSSPFQISSRGGTAAGVVGSLDEIVIYNGVLTIDQVASRYNSGAGTEQGLVIYPTINPTIYPIIPFNFLNPIQTTSETATKPLGTEIKYHISFDNGTIWKYWNGASWITTDDSYTQANIMSEINLNINTLNYSGLFKFRALLNSDGVSTPLLSSFFASDTLTYPQISNVAASLIGYNNATITWTTDLSSDSLVIYGLSLSNLNLSNSNAALVTSHTISLSSLFANTTYFYNVTSCVGIACNSTGTYNFTTSIQTYANISIGSIVQLVTLYKQDTAADIKIACFDSNDIYCTKGATCSLTIFNPDSSTLINNKQMTYNPTFFSYSLNASQTHELGTYTGTVLCSSTNNIFSAIDYQVTPNGEIITLSQTFLILGSLFVMFIVSCFFFVLSLIFKHPGTKIFLMAISTITLIVMIGLIASNASSYFAGFPGLVSIYNSYYILFITLGGVAVIGIVIWFIYYAVQAFNKTRGIVPEE